MMGPPSWDPSTVDTFLSASFLSSSRQLVIPLSLPSISTVSSPVQALIDSGASDSFLDTRFAKKHRLETTRLKVPRNLRLFDGGLAPSGPITHSIVLDILPPKGSVHSHPFLLSSLDPTTPIVLGIDWLASLNPSINWEQSDIFFRASKVIP